MTVCTSCGAAAPDDMKHCSQCGALLPEPEAQAPGNTSHFGDQDLKGLMSRMDREESAQPEDGNLLAGLPRPKAASMLSPLRGGQTSPTARKPEKRARSASGSTVMGMPLFNTGEQRAVQMPRPRPSAPAPAEVSELTPAPLADGSSIQSLGSFQDDFGAPVDALARPRVSQPAAPLASADRSAPPADPSAPPAEVAESESVEPPAPQEASGPPVDALDGPSASLDRVPDLFEGAPDLRDGTSPYRPTERSPAVSSSGGGNTAIVVIVIAAIAAGLAFFLLK